MCSTINTGFTPDVHTAQLNPEYRLSEVIYRRGGGTPGPPAAPTVNLAGSQAEDNPSPA